MRKIIILAGGLALAIFGYFIRDLIPWSPSSTANYFTAHEYRAELQAFDIDGKRASGSRGLGNNGARIDLVYSIQAEPIAISAAIERIREQVAARLEQDRASVIGAGSGTYFFSFHYKVSGNQGYCTIRVFPGSESTTIIVIFFETK